MTSGESNEEVGLGFYRQRGVGLETVSAEKRPLASGMGSAEFHPY